MSEEIDCSNSPNIKKLVITDNEIIITYRKPIEYYPFIIDTITYRKSDENTN